MEVSKDRDLHDIFRALVDKDELSVSDELKRLIAGPDLDELPRNGLLIEVLTTSISLGASSLLLRIKDVLRVAISAADAQWPELKDWPDLLPTWFVDACADQESPEQSAEWLTWWRGLDEEERREATRNRPWSLADWLHWLRPNERQWFWWDASIIGDGSLCIIVEVGGWPTALGALEWLVKAAGGEVIETTASSHPR